MITFWTWFLKGQADPELSCATEGDFELWMFSPLPTKCWDFRCVPPCLARLESTARASCMLGEDIGKFLLMLTN